MFILRRITSESIEINDCLGVSYIMILKERNRAEFENTAKNMGWDDADMTRYMYGFIVYDNGSKTIPLYQESLYFIMASDGKTIANISNKGELKNCKQ